MRKKIWFYLFIIQTCILVIFVASVRCSATAAPKVRSADLSEYISKFAGDKNYPPEAGYIPDAKTANIIGAQILDRLTGSKNAIGFTSIEYDEANRLWKIEKSYLFFYGGFVVIEQDSGKVICEGLSKF